MVRSRTDYNAFSQIRVISQLPCKKVWGTSFLPQVVIISSIKPISSSISIKIKLKKDCKIFHIVFLQHMVHVTGPLKKSRVKPGKEARDGHHCSYTLLKCELAVERIYSFSKIFADFVFSSLYPWL